MVGMFLLKATYGLSDEQLSFCEDPLAGARRALEILEPGDLALLLVLSERDQVIELLQSQPD